ncbi:uncharacterized protein METZ01_LOCUS301482, partial [marine metagenome]
VQAKDSSLLDAPEQGRGFRAYIYPFRTYQSTKVTMAGSCQTPYTEPPPLQDMNPLDQS